jgi:uncharacterized protein (DUF1778 family)
MVLSAAKRKLATASCKKLDWRQDSTMSRISIEIPLEDHKRLQTLAALEGQSLEEFVLKRTLAAARGSDEEQGVLALEAILNERIRRAAAGEVSDESVSQVFEEVYREMGA